jgi:Domain of unknown function (DUF4386)
MKEGQVSADSIGPLVTGQGPPTSPSSPRRIAAVNQRIGPVAGILGVVLLYTGYFIHGYPNASTAELVKWAATVDPNRFRIGINVEAAGILLLLVFFAWLWDVMRRADPAWWLVAVGFGAMLLWVGIGITVNGMWTAVLVAGRRGVDPQTLTGLRDIAQECYNASTLFIVVSMLAVSWAAFRSRVLPTWLSWAALVIALGSVIPVISEIVQLLFTAWVVVIAGLFLFRHNRQMTRDGVPNPAP